MEIDLMARAFVAKELYLEASNETGLLGRITSTFGMQGIYIIHLCAYSVEGRGYLKMVTRDNEKAKKELARFIPKIEERDVLVVEFENKVGTLTPVAVLLGSHNIGIDHVYGTSGDGFKIVGVFSTEDNQRAADIINQESGSLGLK